MPPNRQTSACILCLAASECGHSWQFVRNSAGGSKPGHHLTPHSSFTGTKMQQVPVLCLLGFVVITYENKGKKLQRCELSNAIHVYN